MKSTGGKRSPLSRMPGYHLSLSRGEGMHAGPLGSMPDAAATALVEHCDEGAFGCKELTPWDFRLQTQLNIAHDRFCEWSRENSQEHTVKAFTRLGLSMKTKSKSFSFFCRGKRTMC